MQINNNQQCTQTELPEVHYVYMQTIAVRVDTRKINNFLKVDSNEK